MLCSGVRSLSASPEQVSKTDAADAAQSLSCSCRVEMACEHTIQSTTFDRDSNPMIYLSVIIECIVSYRPGVFVFDEQTAQ